VSDSTYVSSVNPFEDRVARALLSLEGLSVGDAFGECFFLGSPALTELRIIERALPAPPWRTTDDTEMALGILEVLRRKGTIARDDLAATFARRYRRDPGRGYGGGAHQILSEIGIGRNWREVARAAFNGHGSMGNGGAMRAGPVGAWFADDLKRAAEEAAASAEVTHAHPEGQAGAIAVAVAAAIAWSSGGLAHPAAGDRLLEQAIHHTPEGATRRGLQRALDLPRSTTAREAGAALGNGLRVIAPDTVPYALWCAARHGEDYREALWQTVSAQGDMDTNCAIVGSIVALSRNAEIPAPWRAAREPLIF